MAITLLRDASVINCHENEGKEEKNRLKWQGIDINN